ncbi:hypothetical protein LguiB_023628 [Lonicera macranthoides]
MEKTKTIISEKIPSQSVSYMNDFFQGVGVSATIPPNCDSKDFYSDLIRGHFLEVNRVERGKVSCLLSVKAGITNFYGGLHGGAVAAVAEMVAIACARTVVGKEKEIFLGELSNSYLSAAPCNAEVMVDGSVVRSGRNLTVIAIEFRLKDNEKLVYTSRATFYNAPIASL